MLTGVEDTHERMGEMGTSLDHVMIVGGTPADWAAATPESWGDLVARLAEVIAAAGGRWLTLRPYGGSEWERVGDVSIARWSVTTAGDRCTAIVDTTPDGRVGFARAVATIGGRHEIDEKRVAEALYAPADAEPDLIIIFGPHDHLPPSLVWELAYGELVYFDAPFSTLGEAGVRAAIDAFETRDRRFGGLSPS